MSSPGRWIRPMALSVLLLGALVALPLVAKTGYLVNTLINVVRWMIFALAFDLIAGKIGYVSLGQPIFYGIGAYLTAYLAPIAGVGGKRAQPVELGVETLLDQPALAQMRRAGFDDGRVQVRGQPVELCLRRCGTRLDQREPGRPDQGGRPRVGGVVARPVRMPPLGQTSDELRIVAWRKDEGDAVDVGDPLLEVETDKATLEVEAAAGGTRPVSYKNIRAHETKAEHVCRILRGKKKTREETSTTHRV